MALPLKIYRGIIKPRSLPRIDWSHPLSQGLLFYGYDTGAGLIIDLVTGRNGQLITGATAADKNASQWGYGLNYNGSDGRWFSSTSAIQTASGNGSWTFACAYDHIGTAGSGTKIFGRTSSTVGANWQFQLNPAALGQNWLQILYDNGGTGSGSTSWQANTQNTFNTVMGIARGTTALDFYVQGGKFSTDSAINIQSDNTGDSIIFSGNATGSVSQPFPTGFIYYGAFWARQLTDGEAILLHTDPYCFLLYPEEEVISSFKPFMLSPPVSGLQLPSFAACEW